MKRKRWISALLTLALTVSLTACGGSAPNGKTDSKPEKETAGTTGTASPGKEEGEDRADITPVMDWVTYQLQGEEMGTFNILYTASFKELMVLMNCVDSLLSNDTKGNLIPGLAESWEHDAEGKVWTFHLRDNVKWVDYQGNEKGTVSAEDFFYSLEWVLNYHKNESVNTATLLSMVEGAQEYYDYTKGLSYEDAMALDLTKFQEIVTGIQAPDERTLVYTCTYGNTYFDTCGTSQYMTPLAGASIEENGGAEGYKAVDFKTLWYCGPYTITTYVQDNEKMLTNNKAYWDDTAKRFDTVTVKMIESNDTAYQMYRNGELDYALISAANIAILAGGNDEYSDAVCTTPLSGASAAGSFHLNWYRLKEDGSEDTDWNSALANEAFRKSLYWGLDWTNYYAIVNNSLNPLGNAYYVYTAEGLASTGDGRDYTELVKENLGFEIKDDTFSRLDLEKALEYKEQAKEELSAKGVAFPVKVIYHVAAGDQNALDTANVLKQIFTEHLGEDYITFEIGTYVSSFPKEIRAYGLHGLTINNDSADFGDPYAFLSSETYGEGSYWADRIARVDQIKDPELIALFKEFTDLVNEANAISDDEDRRLEAFAKAETFALDHALLWPVIRNDGNKLELTRANDYSKITASYGIQKYRYINWETNVNGYTAKDYEAFQAAGGGGKE